MVGVGLALTLGCSIDRAGRLGGSEDGGSRMDAGPRDAFVPDGGVDTGVDGGPPRTCGDLSCDAPGEDACNCPSDCGPASCNDGVCCAATGEVACECADCGSARCGDGVCCAAELEDSTGCPVDCPESCPNGVCEVSETIC